MRWSRTWRADPRAAAIADRHYNRKSPGSAQFAPPGSVVVLLALDALDIARALWVSTHQLYTDHGLGDVWMNTTFRKEDGCEHLASELIREAVAATRAAWGDPPEGTVSFVDARKVRSSNPGYCFERAGFERLDRRTKDRGLHIWRLAPDAHPDPTPAPRASRVPGQLLLA